MSDISSYDCRFKKVASKVIQKGLTSNSFSMPQWFPDGLQDHYLMAPKCITDQRTCFSGSYDSDD